MENENSKTSTSSLQTHGPTKLMVEKVSQRLRLYKYIMHIVRKLCTSYDNHGPYYFLCDSAETPGLDRNAPAASTNKILTICFNLMKHSFWINVTI